MNKYAKTVSIMSSIMGWERNTFTVFMTGIAQKKDHGIRDRIQRLARILSMDHRMMHVL